MSLQKTMAVSLLVLTVAGCSSLSLDQYQTPDSYLSKTNEPPTTDISNNSETETGAKVTTGFVSVDAQESDTGKQQLNTDVTNQFNTNVMVKVASNELSLPDFLHYVLGDVLKVNYILGESAKNEGLNITLNIQQEVSHRRLFILAEELLAEKGFSIRYNDDIFYINNEDEGQSNSNTVFGYGQSTTSVPNTTANILQIVPFKYGLKGNLSLVLPTIAAVRATPDASQNAILLQGKRSEILKALEFIKMIDAPVYKNRVVAVFKAVFMPIKELNSQLNELLRQDGFNGGISTVQLTSQGALVLFANAQSLMTRAQFWLEKLDVPGETDEKQYFIYQPSYASASDLTESLAPLLGGAENNFSTGDSAAKDNKSNNNNGRQSQKSGIKSAGNENISIVVDQRSNSLIVNAAGQDYQRLLPIIQRLDVLPKQVMLEVVIAEVTLRDEFKYGLEFFLNENNFTLGNKGAFGVQDIGGLSYFLTGSAKWDVDASLNQQNTLINVVSRPSIVVRDGVTANMEVGTDIPIVNTTSAPDIGTVTSVQYRKTGLTLEVTPTVNSQGVVSMKISQEISNVLEGGITAGDAPSIFDRSMSTEVVANSGQTVILGGLISENINKSDTKVPGFGDIPFIGKLFSSQSDVKDKTELVILVTPRIIESPQQWLDIKASFSQELEQIDIAL